MRRREQLEAESGMAVRYWMRAGGVAKPNRAFIFGTYDVEIDLYDESVCPWMRSLGHWESWVHVGLESLIRPGDSCVDVGAHCGYFTMLMAKASGPDGLVFAVEPQKRLADIIWRNVKSNRLEERVQVFEAAITSDAGRVKIGIPGRLTGSASVFHGEDQFDAVGFPFDSLFAEKAVDIVKVDVEGSEVIVWDTSVLTRERNPQSRWLMELAHGRGYDLFEFIKRVEAEGYWLDMLTTEGDFTHMDVGFLHNKNTPAGSYITIMAQRRG